MYVNKEAVFEIVRKLRSERFEIYMKLCRNKGTFKALVKEQTILKRQLPILTNLIRIMEGKDAKRRTNNNKAIHRKARSAGEVTQGQDNKVSE